MSLRSSVTASVEDDRIAFEYEVANDGDSPVELTFRSGLSADFAVLADGEEVWRASDGRMFTQALRTETLDPGESRVFPGAWEEPEPGAYAVVAELNATETGARARAEFSVP